MSVSPSVADLDPAARAPRRVRHEPRRRQLNVKRVDKIAAHMIRVTLGGDLEGFTSLGFDDHIKLFFPDPAGAPGGEPQVLARDYTPRRYNPAGNILEIDFAIHDAGPATRWAEKVRPGDPLAIGGPRGSFIIPTNFDWHLLIGDETAIPAIGRRLAELPAGTRAVVLAEVDGPADELAFDSKADVRVTWAHRNGAQAGASDVLATTLKTMALAGRRLLRLGRLRVADRQGAARAAHRRARRQQEMDAGRRLLAARRGRSARHPRRLERIPIARNRDALQNLPFCACPHRKTGIHFPGHALDRPARSTLLCPSCARLSRACGDERSSARLLGQVRRRRRP